MRKIVPLVFVLVVGSLVLACGESQAEKERLARLAQMSPQERKIQEVLEVRCVKCHTPPDAKKNLDLTDPHNLLPLLNSELLFDDLAVYRMLMGPDTIAEHAKSEFQLKQDEIDMVRRWVLSEHPEHAPSAHKSPSTSSRSFRRADGSAG